jgi:hypothetical protein
MAQKAQVSVALDRAQLHRQRGRRFRASDKAQGDRHMHTTTLASKGDPATYMKRREECAALLALARKIESVTANNKGFLDDPDFLKLESDYKAQFQNVVSLSL